MFTNLLIASVFVIISLIVILNFRRLFWFAEELANHLGRFKLLIEIIMRAYKRYRKILNKPTYQLSPYNYDC